MDGYKKEKKVRRTRTKRKENKNKDILLRETDYEGTKNYAEI